MDPLPNLDHFYWSYDLLIKTLSGSKNLEFENYISERNRKLIISVVELLISERVPDRSKNRSAYRDDERRWQKIRNVCVFVTYHLIIGG